MEQSITLDFSGASTLNDLHCDHSVDDSSSSVSSSASNSVRPRQNSLDSFTSPLKPALREEILTLVGLDDKESFSLFRTKYILTYIAITLADGLQGMYTEFTRRQHI